MFATLALVLSAAVLAPQSAAPAPDFTELRRLLDERTEAGAFSGLVAVRLRGEELFFATRGNDPRTGQPLARDVRFKLFSISKLFTALAVLRLAELETLALDEPAGSYVPDFPAEWSDVTVRQLLQHRSGLPDLTETLFAAFRSDHPQALAETLSAAAVQGVVPAGVGGYRYNNFGYELLASAAAAARGSSFEAVLQELVFDPAGMRTAIVERPLGGATLASVEDPRLVPGFNGAPGKLELAQSLSFVQLGAGAVHATLDDLLALDAALSAGRVVSAATSASMRPSPADGDGSSGYGLGLVCHSTAGLALEGHTGGTNGYVSSFQRIPELGAVLVILSNYGFAELGALETAAVRALLPARATSVR